MRREISCTSLPCFGLIIVVGLCFVFDSRLFVRAVCMPPDDWSYAGREREGGRKRMGEMVGDDGRR